MVKLITFLFIFSGFSSTVLASTCQTIEGIEYQCNNNVNMLSSILNKMEVLNHTAYIYNGKDKVLRHIVKYSDSDKLQSNAYFQDYIYNVSGRFYHLVHFVKIGEGSYNIYIETDILPSGDLSKDISYVSSNVNYLGTSNNLTFDSDGYPTATIQTSTDTRMLFSSKSALNFSVLGGSSEFYNLVYKVQ